jgi:hypothetical protein
MELRINQIVNYGSCDWIIKSIGRESIQLQSLRNPPIFQVVDNKQKHLIKRGYYGSNRN